MVVVFSYLNMEIYLRGWPDIKFYIVTFRKKNMILKTSIENREFPFLEIFELWNKIEEQWSNVEEIVVLFSSDILSNAQCTCAFISYRKRLKLVGYKILLSLRAGRLDNFLNLSIYF